MSTVMRQMRCSCPSTPNWPAISSDPSHACSRTVLTNGGGGCWQCALAGSPAEWLIATVASGQLRCIDAVVGRPTLGALMVQYTCNRTADSQRFALVASECWLGVLWWGWRERART